MLNPWQIFDAPEIWNENWVYITKGQHNKIMNLIKTLPDNAAIDWGNNIEVKVNGLFYMVNANSINSTQVTIACDDCGDDPK